MILRVRLAAFLIPVFATIAGWRGGSFEFCLLDENKTPILKDDLTDDTDIYYVKLMGFRATERDFNP